MNTEIVADNRPVLPSLFLLWAFFVMWVHKFCYRELLGSNARTDALRDHEIWFCYFPGGTC